MRDFLANGWSGAGDLGVCGRGIPSSRNCTGLRSPPNLRSTGRSKKTISVTSFASFRVTKMVWRSKFGVQRSTSEVDRFLPNREFRESEIDTTDGELNNIYIRLLLARFCPAFDHGIVKRCRHCASCFGRCSSAGSRLHSPVDALAPNPKR